MHVDSQVDQRIRDRIRAEMTAQGLTQVELARRLGIRPPSLSQVLSGSRGRVPQSLLDVLDELGLTIQAVAIESDEERSREKER
jgi:transcriptional regulator with XRE-family HTH domain